MSDRTGLAEKVATGIAGFSKADYEEGCEPMLAMSAAEWIEILSALRQSQSPDRDAGEGMREAAYQAARKTADEMHARAKRMEDDPALSDKAGFVDSCANFVDVLAFGMLTLPLSPEGRPSC